MKKKLNNFFNFFLSRNILVFAFFLVLIFFLFHNLFNSYFEADEWPAFAYNLPLTRDPLGFLKILITGDTGASLLQVQHIVFLSKEVFFLNTLLFGTNFFPYASISLLIHAINSFLVFVFVRQLLPKKSLYAFLSAVFFSILPTQMHAITWAAIYSSSSLPITFSLLSLIFLKLAFSKKDKKFIYLSVLMLFLSLFSKETAFFLFFLLPLIVYFEKRIFPLKSLGKIFFACLVLYSLIRFIIPGIYNIQNKVQNHPKDTGTIVSRDVTLYKNLPGEILFRSFTFPFRMMGTLFLPRETVTSISQLIAPVIVPLKSIDPSVATDGSEMFVVIYLIALGVFVFCIKLILKFSKTKDKEIAQAIAIALLLVVLGALTLVPIIFTFPRWGYDYYFDSRYYYGPSIGAAIIFPFLLFGIAKFISRLFNIKSFSAVVSIVFLIWLINNMYVFGLTTSSLMNIFGSQRREIISQVQTYLPILPKKTVFYFQTDGNSILGPALPFYTSVPQALGDAYYNKSPLPGNLLTNPLNGKSEGFSSSHGRGLGYYMSKKSLSEDLVLGKFASSDIYAFYYYAKEVKIKDITEQIRSEMNDYLKTTDRLNWKVYEDPVLKVKFLYPKYSSIKEISDVAPNVIKSLLINDPKFSATISFINVSLSFDIHETTNFLDQKAVVADKDVSFDKYHSNKVTVVTNNNRYFMKLNTGVLLEVKPDSGSAENLSYVERILGSLENL